MNGVNRQRAALGAVFLSLVFGLIFTTPTASADEDANIPGERSLAGCLQTASDVSVLFLLDRSGSLSQTDPDGLRYEGLELALRRLANIQNNAVGDVAIDAGLASFDGEYAGVADFGGWRRINDDKSDDTIKDLLETVRNNTQPRGDTVYENALIEAEADLEDRGGDRSCRVLIWFTDGAMSDALDASQRMCAPGGLMDRIRGQRITVVGLRLQDPSGAVVEQTADMEAMTIGRDANSTCGTWPIPEGSRPGVFLEAQDKAGLRRLFTRALDGADGCSKIPGPSVDPGMHRFRVVIDAPPALTSIRFDGPGGAQFLASVPGNSRDGDVVAQARVVDGLVTVDIEFPQSKQTGVWTVTPNVAVASDEIAYFECPDVTLAVDSGTRPVAGGLTSLPLQLRDSTGAHVDPSVYQDLVVSAVVTGPDGQPRKTTSGQPDPTGIPVEVTLLPNDTQANLSAKVSMKSASGVDLFVPELSVTFPTKMSDAWPLVVPGDQLRLPPAIHKKSTSGELTLTGSPKGPTKVCFGPPKDVKVPADETGVVPQYPTGCVDLRASESKKVTVTVTPTQSGQGPAQATVPITLHSAPVAGKPSETAPLPLRVEWRFENPPNTPALLIALLIGVILALAPLAAVVLANKVSARYEIRGLATSSIPVVLDAVGIRRSVPFADESLAGRIIDTTQMAAYPTRGKRWAKSVTVAPVILKARAPWNPFAGARFWVELPKSFTGFSTAGSLRGGLLPASPGLGFLAVVAVDRGRIPTEEGVEVPATLVVFRRDRKARGEELDDILRASLGSDVVGQLQREPSNQRTSVGQSAATEESTGKSPVVAPVLGHGKRKK